MWYGNLSTRKTFNQIYFPGRQFLKEMQAFGEKLTETLFQSRNASFYLPHMEYEGNIGLVSKKMIFFFR
jgi:hypothetical protein